VEETAESQLTIWGAVMAGLVASIDSGAWSRVKRRVWMMAAIHDLAAIALATSADVFAEMMLNLSIVICFVAISLSFFRFGIIFSLHRVHLFLPLNPFPHVAGTLTNM